MERPNIFFIILDELRSDALGCMGNTAVRTPNIDAFARDCSVFENCFCSSPMCAPSRESLATGRRCLSHGVLDNGFIPLEGEVSLYGVLKENGYRTINYGKLHTNCDYKTMGFDEHHPSKASAVTVFGITDRELRAKAEFKKNEGDISIIIHGKSPVPANQTPDSVLTNEFVSALKNARGNNPVLMRLSILDPHSPYIPSKPYCDLYDPAKLELPPSFCCSVMNKPVLQRYFYKTRGFDRLEEMDYRKAISSYYGLVSHVDDRVGMALDELKRLGLYDDAAVILTSDHGTLLGEHGFIEKWGPMYDELLRIPLLIKLPRGMNKGAQRLNTFAENIDIMPTLLHIAGIAAPGQVQGKSLLPLLTGKTMQHKDKIFAESFCGGVQNEPVITVRDKQWKLTYYPAQDRLHEMLPGDHYLKYSDYLCENIIDGELYDLTADPHEINNLFSINQYSNIKEKYMNEINQFINGLGNIVNYRAACSTMSKQPGGYSLIQGNGRKRIADFIKSDGALYQCRRNSN
ncbi:MAG: sulfatase-like hydrolase/transferase [Treponema sp.]|nr:sulfatase-like hydrolase/transferase [Treponema sp.]